MCENSQVNENSFIENLEQQIIVQPQQTSNKRVFRIENQEYCYEGTQNSKLIKNLLGMLQQMEKDDQQKQSQQKSRVIMMLYEISNKIIFERNICKINLILNVSQLLIIIIYWCVFIYMLVESIILLNQEKVKENEQIKQLVNYLPLMTFLYTLGCQILSHYNNQLMWFVVYIFLFLTPQIVLLENYKNYIENNFQSQDQITIVFCLLCLTVFLKSLFNQIIKRNFESIFYQLNYSLINCGCYILSTVFIDFKTIKLLTTMECDDNQSFLKPLLAQIKVPIFILLLCYQSILLKDLFRENAKDILEDINNYSLQIEVVNNYDILDKYNFYRFLKWTQILAILFIFSVFIYSFTCLCCELSLPINTNDSVIFYFTLMIAAPLFLIYGSLILNSDFFGNNVTKYLWIPIIYCIQSIIFNKFAIMVTEDSKFKYASEIIVKNQHAFFIFWLQILNFRSEERFQKFFSTVLFFYFWFFPTIILTPISEMKHNDDLNRASLAFFIIGIICIGFRFVPFIFCFLFLLYSRTVLRIFDIKGFDDDHDFTVFYKIAQNELFLNAAVEIYSFQIFSQIFELQQVPKYQGVALGFQIVFFIHFLINFMNVQTIITCPRIVSKLLKQKQKAKIKKIIIFGSITSLLVFLLFFSLLKNEKIQFIFFLLALGIPILNVYFGFTFFFTKNPTYRNSLKMIYILVFDIYKLITVSFLLKVNIPDDPDDVEFYIFSIFVQSIFLLFFLLACLATSAQQKYLEKRSTYFFHKKLFESLMTEKIFLSKNVLENLNPNRIKPKELEQNLKYLQISLLYFDEETDNQFSYFLFISEIFEYDQKKYVFYEKSNLIGNVYNLLFCERDSEIINRLFLNKTLKQFIRIELSKEKQHQIILELFQQQEQKGQVATLQKPPDVNELSTKKICCFKLQKSYLNIFKLQDYGFLKQRPFKNQFQTQLFVSLNEFQHYEDIFSLINESYQIAYKEWEETDKFQDFILNLSNILSLASRLYEYFTILSLIINLQENSKLIQFQQFIDLSFITNFYLSKLYVALAMTFFHSVFGCLALQKIFRKTYNHDINYFKLATYFDWGFWLNTSVLILNTQFAFVCKTFLKAFFCDFSHSPLSLLAYPSITCMSEIHLYYILISIIGCFFYFSISAFLYPILQHQSKSANYRFKCQYVSLFMVAKLMIVVPSVFSATKRFQNFMLQANCYIFTFLGIYCYAVYPCLVKFCNILEIILISLVVIIILWVLYENDSENATNFLNIYIFTILQNYLCQCCCYYIERRQRPQRILPREF